MKRINKTIFFLFLSAIFFTITPLIISYSLGWRIDWTEKRAVQPGVFYFKVLPKSSQIFLNGKLKKKTDFFFGSALIENISPKKYSVEIKKEGFQTWKKTLEIKKGQATEAKNILLVSQNPKFNAISDSANEFWVLPDEKNIIIQEFTAENHWFLSIFDLNRKIKIPLLGANDLSSVGPNKKSAVNSQLLSLKFSFDSKKVLIETSENKKTVFYLLELDKEPISFSYLALSNTQTIKEVYFEPANSQKLLFLQDKNIFEKSLAESKKEPVLFKTDAIFLFVSGKYIFYLNNSGFLFRINPVSLQEDKLNATSLQSKKDAEYELFTLNSYIFLKENDILYKLDEKGNKFDLVAESVKDAVFSPDAKKLAYFSDKEIWLFFLEKIYEQPQKEKGEKLFLTRFSNDLNRIFWLTGHQLVFNSGRKIKIAETDERDNVNIFNIGDLKEPEIFWNQSHKELFVLSEKNLYFLEKLVP